MSLDIEAAIKAGERAADDFREIARTIQNGYLAGATTTATVDKAKRLTMIAGAANALVANLLILQEMEENRRAAKATLMREMSNDT